jgi:hypothetical protein
VIIFSDKTITWPENKPIDVAWPRFYRRAVADSVDQISGAARWIAQFPDKIFTDPGCAQKLPIDLPSGHRRKLHGVVVANGAYKACQQWTNDDSGCAYRKPNPLDSRRRIGWCSRVMGDLCKLIWHAFTGLFPLEAEILCSGTS